jgi:spore coat protein CotH
MNDLVRLPYGEILPGKYYQKDKYGDNHPVFNLSIIGNWHIEMDDKDYNDMLLPVNTYNQSHVDVKAYFSNGNINEKVHKVSMKLKGHFARLGVKKSFQIRFGDDFYHLNNLVFKAPALDPTYLHNLFIGEYLRAMMVPAARGSYATLTINGVFWGLFWMREELDQNFIHSRFGNDKGNFYAMSDYLRYLGDDQAVYKNITKDSLGSALPIYNQEFGNSNWADLVAFAKFINTSTDEEFANEVETWVNVDGFIRAMVVLSAINDIDTYTVNGNNWNLYHNPENNLWEFVLKDFEETMINPFADALGSVANNAEALFAYRLMNITKYVGVFNDYYAQFLDRIFDPSMPHSAKNRAEVLVSFLEQIIDHDPFYHITYGLPISTTAWKLLVKEMQYFMELRNYILKTQFPAN